MENNQNQNNEKKVSQNEGNSGNRNRHRRFNRHRRPKNDGEKKQNQSAAIDKSFFAPDDTQKDSAPAQEKKNQQPKKNKTQNPEKSKDGKERSRNNNSNNNNSNNNNNNKKNKNRSHGRSNFHRGGEQRPYDPYEEVRPEELSLEELRARIVLNRTNEEKPAGAAVQEEASAVDALPSVPASMEATPATEEPVERIEVIGVRFRSSRKTYYFDPRGIKGKKGEFAVVETARGAEFGEISLANTMINAKEVVSPLRPVLRIASPEDIRHDEENRQKEKEALAICQERVLAHKLEMKLIDVQYAFDNSKLLFYFTAEGRVDFRDLVKDLASYFRTRIELRQIGIRDEAKMLGGLGACGRSLCCSTFLPDFAQVSIKMAKDQNLSLNSAKISGLCGRLMCCLRYESEVYAEEIRLTPSNDSTVKTPDGIGTVISSNPLAGTIRVLLKDSPDTPPKQFHRSEVTVIGKGKRENSDGKAEKAEKSN